VEKSSKKLIDKPVLAWYDLAMETNSTTQTQAQAPVRRRPRSENVGWGSIPRLVNRERAQRDAARKASTAPRRGR
jgi:hypothetical protein